MNLLMNGSTNVSPIESDPETDFSIDYKEREPADTSSLMGLDEIDKFTSERSGLVDEQGNPSDAYTNWMATSPIAEKYGYTKPREKGVLESAGAGLAQGYHTGIRSMARSFSAGSKLAEDIAKEQDVILENNQQWNLSDRQNKAGWAAYQAANAVASTAPTVAVGAALAMVPELSSKFVLAAMATTSFAQVFGDNLEKVKQDSNGKLDPYSELGSAMFISALQAGVEIGGGPERLLAQGIAKQGFSKFIQQEGNRSLVRNFGKMMFEGRINKALMSGLSEGAEEVAQLASYDSVMNAMTGRKFSPLSEYSDNAAAGFVGGTFLGTAGAMLNNVVSQTSKASVEKKLYAPVTEETQSKIYQESNPILNNEAMVRTRQTFDAFKANLPDWAQPATVVIETIAHNLSAMTDGSVKPEQYINDLKTVFLGEDAAGYRNKASKINKFLQGKNTSEEVISVLRENIKDFDSLVKNAQDTLHHKITKNINDAVEEEHLWKHGQLSNIGEFSKYTPVTKDNLPEYKSFLSTIFGNTVIDKLWGQKQEINTIDFNEVRDLAKSKAISSSVIKALKAEGEVNGVEVTDSSGRQFNANFKFNDDFSITITKSTPEDIAAAKEDAAVKEQVKADLALKPGKGMLKESNTEIEIAKEALRSVRLAKKGQTLDEFDSRWKEFLNGTDTPTTTRAAAGKLVVTLNQMLEERQSSEELSKALDDLNKALAKNQKLLPAAPVEGVIRLPASGVLEKQELDRAIKNAYEVAERASRGLPAVNEEQQKIAEMAGYNLNAISQRPDPEQSLLDEIDSNVRGGNVVKWRKDQLNKIAMRFGVKLKGLDDVGKAKVIFMALPGRSMNRRSMDALFKAIDEAGLGREGGGIQREVFNAQTDETIKGQYLKDQKLAIFYKTADAETIVHEWMHHLRVNALLPAKVNNALTNQFAVNGKWTDEAEEDAVSAFLTWMKTQELPENASIELKGAFESVKSTLSVAYQKVMKNSGDVLNQKATELNSVEMRNLDTSIRQNGEKAISQMNAAGVDPAAITQFTTAIRDSGYMAKVWESDIKGILNAAKLKLDSSVYDSLINQIPQWIDATAQSNLLLSKSKESVKDPVVVSPEVSDALSGLLDPVDKNTLESIYGEALAESMENSEVINDDSMSNDEISARVELAVDGKVLNSKGKTKKSDLWRRLHGKYKDHAKVLEVLGLKEGQGMADVSIKDIRNALGRDNGKQLEWLQKKGFQDGSFEELSKRSSEAKYFAERELEDETTSKKVSKIKEGITPKEAVEPIVDDLVKEQIGAVSYSNRVPTTAESERLTILKNSANRWMQRLVRWTYGLRDLSKFLGPKFYNEVWGRLQTPNNEVAKQSTAVEDEYISKMTSNFAKDTAKTVALPSGRIMSVNDMIAIYAMSEGNNLKESDVFGKDGQMNPRYNDVVAWLYSNVGADMTTLNEAIDYVNSNPELKGKVIEELDYMTGVSNKYFDEAAKVYKEINGKELKRLNKRWYTSLARQNGGIHEADVATMFDKFDGTVPNYSGINKPSAFNQRFGGAGGKVSLEYRNNFLHHLGAMINYKNKAVAVRDSMNIISNPAFQVALTKRFGDDNTIPDTLSKLVKREMSPSGKWKRDEGVADNTLGQLRANIYSSLLSWNIGMYPMQLTSWPMAFNELGLNPKAFTQMTKNTMATMWQTLKNSPASMKGASVRYALKDWDVWQNVKQYGAPIARRLGNPDAENMRRRNRESWIAKMIPGAEAFIERGNLIMEAGDMAVVIGTWNTMFEMKKEQLAAEHSGWSDEQIATKAGQIATEAVMATQSPSTVGEKSLFQTGTELEKMQIPFSGQAFTVFKSIMNNTVIPVLESIKTSKTTGEAASNLGKVIFSKHFSGRVLAGWVLPAIAMGVVARRRPPKDEKEMALDILCYALGTIPVIGNAIWMSVAMGWDKGTPSTFYQELLGSVVEGTKGLVTGDTSGVKDVARAASMITGSPIVLNRIVETALERGFAKEGWDMDALKQITGMKAKD
jgi:hypothetical protein